MDLQVEKQIITYIIYFLKYQKCLLSFYFEIHTDTYCTYGREKK